ncbi:glycosyl hydrolase 115 family protein [Maribacter sedimenticola]|nr:glycosyl hydrolase 115 family protein [Maribacter sedimenticola]
MRKILLAVILLPQLILSQFNIVDSAINLDVYFPIVTTESPTTIYMENTDFPVVKKSVNLFAEDVHKVTNQRPSIINNIKDIKKFKGNIILVGTLGQNKWIDELVQSHKLNVSTIQDQPERYLIQTIKSPFRKNQNVLVITGSDKRGTAYGVFSLSEAMGVSPWYYWADVPVEKKKEIYLKNLSYTSKSPSVKYRGIFLNDEDWGLLPWAANKMDSNIQNIGPNTYEKVFELVLRLKGNMVAPAMHEVTKAFYTVPGNMEMADSYAIMITTAHCEPLLYNNATEWDKKTQGEWNYVTNKKEINRVLDERVNEAKEKENIYTIALRGMHDEGMSGGSDEQKFKMLDEAIKDQRAILTKYMNDPIVDVPQIFVPYKEVLGLYEKGLEVPEDIIIVWPDDNYGYIKKVSNKKEQQRSGGAGVYYHISYLGWPNDYLWLNTTPPALMYTEMQKAYSLGADKYWLLNVGDIKPGEMGMQLFMDMAWDFDRFNFENINDYQVEKLTHIFGEQYTNDLAYILDRYYYHGFTRKPEYMTGDWKWNSLEAKENIKDTDFSFINYNEAETRLAEYAKIAQMATEILKELPEEKKAAFYEMVYYPLKGASLYNHEMLLAQKNRWYAKQQRTTTNELAAKVVLYHDSLADITKKYNNLLNRKWNGMMTAPGFLPQVQIAPTKKIITPKEGSLEIFVEGSNSEKTENQTLPLFSNLNKQSHFIEVYNTGKEPLDFYTTTSAPWLILDRLKGTVQTQERINVSVIWDRVPNLGQNEGEIIIHSSTEKSIIKVVANKQVAPNNSIYMPIDGLISINPTNFHRKTENGGIHFQEIPGLGYSNEALQLGNATFDKGYDSYVAYDFYVEKPGEVIIQTVMLPLFSKDKEHGTAYGVQLDEQDIVVQSNFVKEYSQEWAKNVMRNSAINSIKMQIDTPGKHTLKLHVIDPGMVVQKVMLDFGGLKKSYVGPKTFKFQNRKQE